MKRKNQKGFTLVEVIVVAVIVAVLAAVAIPLYIGYINDANRNSAQNAAGSAASFLAAARNAQTTVTFGGNNAGDSWTCTSPATNTPMSFRIPDGVSLTVTANSVTAVKSSQSSDAINY